MNSRKNMLLAAVAVALALILAACAASESSFPGTYTAEDGSTVTIQLEENEYHIAIELLRLTAIDDCVGVLEGDKLVFTGTDASGEPIKGAIEFTDSHDEIKLTFTDSTWTYLSNGTELYFSR